MRDRIHALFMSRQQTVYLFTLMLNCVIYGMLMPTFLMLDVTNVAKMLPVANGRKQCYIYYYDVYNGRNQEYV